MCGRYSNVATISEIEANFKAKVNFDFKPVYNIAPTLKLPVITNTLRQEVQAMEWSYVAPWNKKLNVTNATCEKVTCSNVFTKSLREKRCIVLATSVFEWRQDSKPKQPYLIYVEDQPVFGMAGLWKSVVDEETGEEVNQFTIITTTPNDVMHRVGHHRMPVILEKSTIDLWLGDSDIKSVCELLKEYPAEKMNAYPVSTNVNKASFNTLEALEAIGEKVR